MALVNNPHLNKNSGFVPIVWYSLKTLNRKRELERLIVWASYKGFRKVRLAYAQRRDDDELRLFRYEQYSREAVHLARVVHTIAGLLFPPPKGFRRGAAAAYRSRYVDTRSK